MEGSRWTQYLSTSQGRMYHKRRNHIISTKGTQGERTLGQRHNQKSPHGPSVEPKSGQLNHGRNIAMQAL